MSLLFGGIFVVYYLTDINPAFSTHYSSGFDALGKTWLAMVVHLILLASLLATTVIDARFFIIALPIPWFVTAVAAVIFPVGLHHQPDMGWVIPMTRLSQTHLTLGALGGLVVALALLHLGWIPRSFQDAHVEPVDSDTPTSPDHFLNYPHPRREVLKEIPFIVLPIGGAILAYFFIPLPFNGYPTYCHGFGGVVFGYLMGCGLIWVTRVLGTLAFGKEAIGLGDVHLLGSIGAVLGGAPVVLVFFVAPFFGLLGALLIAGISALLKGQVRIIPYGPYLAAATLLVMATHGPKEGWLIDHLRLLFEAFRIL